MERHLHRVHTEKPSAEAVETGAIPLFDFDAKTGEIDVVLEKPHVEARVARAALRLVESQEPAVRPEHPETLTVTELAEMIDRERDTPVHDDVYSELGGGIPNHWGEAAHSYRFENAIDAYEDWHEHTRQAVERYRLADMTTSDFDAMRIADQKRFSGDAFILMESMKTVGRLLADTEHDVRSNQTLVNIFGATHELHELHSYGRILQSMVHELEEDGLAGRIRSQLNVPSPRVRNSQFYYDRRNKALANAERHRKRYGTVQVRWEKGRFVAHPLPIR